jgi:hypothetical protein
VEPSSDEVVSIQVRHVIVRYTKTTKKKGGGEKTEKLKAKIDVRKVGALVWGKGLVKDSDKLPDDVEWLDIKEDTEPDTERERRDEDPLCFFHGGMYYCC